MKRTLIGLALSFSMLGGMAARADEPTPPQAGPGQGPGFHHGDHGGPGAELHHIFAQLDLSADQKAQLKQLHASRMVAEKAARHDMGEARKAFAAAMRGNSSDEALRSAHNALSQKREAFEAQRFEDLLQVRKLLTADQRTRFDGLWLDFKHHQRARAAGEE